MLFNSAEFLLFFLITFLIYLIWPRKYRYIWLLVASYVFYCSWNVRFATLIITVTLVTYLGGLILERVKTGRRAVVTACVICCLGILFYFKYINFFLESINALMPGGGAGIPAVEGIILPVGISFYTFQALSYTIDVYRGDTSTEHNFLKYALYISFFPQLVAGPIERSGRLLSRISDLPNVRILDVRRLRSGFITLLWGLFLKMMIADRIAVLVDEIYAHYYRYGTLMLALGAAGFSIQIYCDFAGYSVAAVGAARIMGIEIMSNFETPYLAQNIRDFWRRWHISLSTWFRDYIYIPLGGSRRGKVRKYINLMITFLLSGLWHGAGWTFVIWGGIHGAYQIMSDITAPVRGRIIKAMGIRDDTAAQKGLRICVTFIMTTIAWIFFRAKTLKDALSFIGRMFTKPDIWTLFDGSLYELGLERQEIAILFFALLLLALVSILQYRKGMKIDRLVTSQNLWFQFLWCLGLCAIIMLFGIYGRSDEVRAFIYFQF